MVFWRRKNNIGTQEREEREDRIIHRPSDPAIEPPTEYDSDISPDFRHVLQESEKELLDELNEEPVPDHTVSEDARESEDLSDHTGEGGWLSRLAAGLSKSTHKLTSGIADLLTKSKLDQKALDRLEELLIEADLGPKTAEKIIKEFSKDRFGKDITEQDIRRALAQAMAAILEPVAAPLTITKPETGPFTIIVCGVNGVGKTTTIGKLAGRFSREGQSVMIAAGDTFRAAALEQLGEWAKRAGCGFYAKDIGADAAAVAFESYEKALKDNADILLIDTAGRLHNKKNLMEELQKIVRVLRKRDAALPHAVLLVLDATTGQNAFAQVETFREMVNVTGLVVTKLDGSAKGGVLVGLADRFGLPVHAVGIGEGLEDMRPFSAEGYANSLMGL